MALHRSCLRDTRPGTLDDLGVPNGHHLAFGERPPSLAGERHAGQQNDRLTGRGDLDAARLEAGIFARAVPTQPLCREMGGRIHTLPLGSITVPGLLGTNCATMPIFSRKTGNGFVRGTQPNVRF